MTMALENPKLLSIAAGFTDSHSLPVAEVSAAVAKLAGKPSDPEHLQYGTNQGRAGLRRVLAERLQRWEPANSEVGTTPTQTWADRMVITNGSQQVLYLAMQVLCDPGDIVLVDRPSYFVFLEMLTGLGLRAVSLPTDANEKLDPVAIGKLLDQLRADGQIDRVKALYFVSYFSNPSGRSLTTTEKDQLAEVLQQKGVIIPAIEDAAYRELYFQERDETPSVLGLPSWKEFPKLYTSTLTKPFASGLKIGFGVSTDQSWLDKILHAKGHHDFGSTNFNQAICETVLANGDFDRQLMKVREAYLAKCDALDRALEKGGLRNLGWSWTRPLGGLYLWLQAPKGLNLGLNDSFCRACIKEGVLYVPGDLCFGDFPAKDTARLSFGVLNPEKLTVAGERFCRVAHQFH